MSQNSAGAIVVLVTRRRTERERLAHMIDPAGRKTLIRAAVLVVLAVLTLLGVTNILLDNTVGKLIVDPARAYVADAREEALNGFLLLSAVKAIVAIVEDSDVGGLQVGDIVQSLYDAIDICWKMMFVSLSTLVVLEFLLSLSSLLSKWMIGITLLAWLLFTVTKRDLPRRLLTFFASMAFLFYLAVPVSLVLASHISRSITEPVRNEFDTALEELKTKYEAEVELLRQDNIVGFGVTTNPANFLGATVNLPTAVNLSFPLIDSVERLADELKDVYEKLVELLFTSGIAWLFDVLIVPVGLLYVFYRISLILLEKLVGGDSASHLQNAVEKAFKKSGAGKAS